MNLRCIIVDDEPNAVNLLEMLVGQTTNWQLLAKCYNALEAIAFLKTNTVDFIFLDINMPQLNGMELASLLGNNTSIVFTTAYSEHAVDSYAFNTIDYLLKPITLKRFLSAVQKIESYFNNRIVNEKEQVLNEDEYFFVKSGREIRKIRLEDILYFESEKEYVQVVTLSDQFLIYRRLKDIEALLHEPFVRVHHSYIVNIKQIHKIQDNHIYITQKQIPISDKFREAIMALIQKKMF